MAKWILKEYVDVCYETLFYFGGLDLKRRHFLALYTKESGNL